MKKLSVLLALLMALSCLLIACTTPGSGNTDTTAADSATEAPTDVGSVETPAESTTEAPTEAPSTKVTYTVTVKDQNGDAVVGAAVQMCDDNGCKMPVPTDENGVVTFTYDPSNYHITIVECPAGYTVDPTQSFYFAEGSTELTVEIQKN